MEIVRCAMGIQRSCLSIFRIGANVIYLFKQKKKERRKTQVEFWLLESSGINIRVRSIRAAAAAAHGIDGAMVAGRKGGLVCFEGNL